MGEASPKVKVKQEKTQTLWSQNQRWEFYELSLFKKNSIQLCFEKIKSKHIVRFANYNLCNVFIHPSFTLILLTLFSFTLEKGDSPFIHPFSTQTSWRFTLQKGDSPFLRVIHPSRRVIHPQGWIRSPFLKGESSFQKLIHPSRRVIHPSKRVNGRVNRVNHPSKGEWRFA